MSPNRNQVSVPRPVRRLGAAILIVVGAVVALGVVLVWREFGNHTVNSYVKEIEDAHRTGVPVSAKEFQAPLPPPDQNAAPLYTKLTSILKSRPLAHEDEIAEWLTAPQMPSGAQFERVRRAFQHRPELLPMIRQAATRKQCVFVRDWSDPSETSFDELGFMREAARLLVGESRLLVHEGKALLAVRNQVHGFGIARHLMRETTLIGCREAVRTDATTFGGLQTILTVAGTPTSAVGGSARSPLLASEGICRYMRFKEIRIPTSLR